MTVIGRGRGVPPDEGHECPSGWCRTCFDYAETLLERDNTDDRHDAMVLPDESLAISTELGMRPLKQRVLSRRAILDS